MERRRALWIALIGGGALAAENPVPEDYRPPGGFAGYEWNTALVEFKRLQPDPVYVRIAHSSGVVTDFDMDCFMNGASTRDCSRVLGEGFHALAEYYVDSQGFRLNDAARNAKTVLFPITYQFCANWTGFSPQMRGDVLSEMKLCGARLHFRSVTATEEAALAFDDVTSADRVLNWLIRNHGEPERFKRRGTVAVGLENTPKREPRKDRYENWFWCSPKGGDPAPNSHCPASIVYAFDSETGKGQVIFLTPDVWMYAHARRYGGAEDDPLYRVLYGLRDRLPPIKHVCTGTFLCKPPPSKPMPEKMFARFRLPDTTK